MTQYEKDIASNHMLPRVIKLYESVIDDLAAQHCDIVATAFVTYCEKTGYATPSQLEEDGNRQMTKEGLADALAALLLVAGRGKTHDGRLLKTMLSNKRILDKVLSAQHDLWAWRRIQSGWSYGETKDKALKKNPCLKEFSLLTEEEVSWDRMFLDLALDALGGNDY